MRGFKYIPSLIPAVFVIAGNTLGYWWAGLNLFYTLVVLVLVDLLSPHNQQPNKIKDSTIPDFFLFLSVLLHTTAISTLFLGIFTETLTGWFVVLAAISTGLNSGINGITVAHELIHRKERFWRALGIWNLVLVNYSHFFVEHIRGHHARVGTMEDPATARKGESIYRFFGRTVIQQYQSALRLEAKKQARRKRPTHGLNNFVLRYTAIALMILVALTVLGGWIFAVAHLIQSIVAVFLLETVNYAEHYGLTREPDQRVTVDHSWQSDVVSSRLTLIELSRHTDHHLKASKPYHQLVSHANGKFLPFGYFGMLYPVLIPPLWFRLVDPLLQPSPTNSH